jgi:glutaredoxin
MQMKSLNSILPVCLFCIVLRSNAAEIACPEVAAFQITECGKATLESFSFEKSTCDPAFRIVQFVYWLDSLAKPCSTVIKSVRERYAFYRDTTKYPIVYPAAPLAGSPDAPVRITAYISMSCPLCKKICSDLADSLQGRRARQMALYVKPASTTTLEHAFVAVQKCKKEAALFRALAPLKERVTMQTILGITDSIGINRQEFDRLLIDKATVAWTDSSRAEATRNGVTSVPTLFINGRPYPVYKTARWVIDAAEYEWKKTLPPEGSK